MSAASPSEVMMTNKVGPMYDESVPEVIGNIPYSLSNSRDLSGGRPRRGGDSADCRLTGHLSHFIPCFLVFLSVDSGRV